MSSSNSEQLMTSNLAENLDTTPAAAPRTTRDMFYDTSYKLQDLVGRRAGPVIWYDFAPLLLQLLTLLEEAMDITAIENMDSIDRLLIAVRRVDQATDTDDWQYVGPSRNQQDYTLDQLFYVYFDLLNAVGLKNYLKRVDNEDNVRKQIYKNCVTLALHFMQGCLFFGELKLSKTDCLQLPSSREETLQLMLKFVQHDLQSNTEYVSMIADDILWFLFYYSKTTSIIPNLISTGYPEAVLNWITLAITTNKSVEVVLNDDSDYKTSAYEDQQNPEILRFIFGTRFTRRYSKIGIAKSETMKVIISIVYNISRHDDGIKELNSFGAIATLKQVQKTNRDHKINLVFCMTLALLLTPQQIKEDPKERDNVLDQLLHCALKAFIEGDSNNSLEARYITPAGFHICEPLVVLSKMFNDDRALNYILEKSQVVPGYHNYFYAQEEQHQLTTDFFINLLLNFHRKVTGTYDSLRQLTLTALVNILWSVSFQDRDEYKQQLTKSSELMTLLEKFAKEETESSEHEYMPRFIENIQTAAAGILLNLSEKPLETKSEVPRGKSTAVDPLDPSKINSSTGLKTPVMISYSHADKTLCYQLYDELKRSEQFDVWIDRDHCDAGDSWDIIAKGIKGCHVVLPLITANYQGNSIRREVIYTLDRVRKPMVPVFVHKPALPDWLDIRTCEFMHVKIADEKRAESGEIATLIRTIHALLDSRQTGGSAPPIHHQPVVPLKIQAVKEEKPREPASSSQIPTAIPEKPVKQWNKADVKQWFEACEILSELHDLYCFKDGQELLSYAQILSSEKNGEAQQFQVYSDEFERRYSRKRLLPHEFKRFTTALLDMMSTSGESGGGQKPMVVVQPAAAVSSKSQTCEIL